MTDIFLERQFDPPLTAGDVLELGRSSMWCLDMHRVEWRGSLLSVDGQRLFCRFAAPDAESARAALRLAGAEAGALWVGTVHDVDEPPEPNVLVERRFDEPADLDRLQRHEDAHAWCLETHRVRFARTYFSRDKLRMICLYRAPDAESVRAAQREAGMPVERVWAFEPIGADGGP